MNKPSDPKTARQWITASVQGDAPVPGYDAWLARDITAGLADADAGRVTPLADVRKEFGLE